VEVRFSSAAGKKAFQLCQLLGARDAITKLDRLSRDIHFLLGLEKAGVDFVAIHAVGAPPDCRLY
jgi:hypothetical protein